ncbi:hypothetical protein [Micromonospora parathelypteridis]|uniref:Uncharacterized protein n=1 Tax=Micromonospora parathelypteridis TaxID=1839617 RepID=A0A840W8C5_9ACTN|nr:hypothetical protein [Micromonospora parathelypteridis]MBB5479301.1 hypothetical protein [Micromonospora parathelypteridis]GGO01969.1 hypothetical protein GCM10011576_00970 [Micromonospora parathelypteridis]
MTEAATDEHRPGATVGNSPVEAPARVHIVVTCANRKNLPVPAALRVGAMSDYLPRQRLAEWIRRLSDPGQPSTAATSLYAGEHWAAARQLATSARVEAQLWVCSAGYGLIPATAYVHPYAATFTLRADDSVGRSSTDNRDWWHGLTEWVGPEPGTPRSFHELARTNPDDTIIAVLSETYLRSCSHDLRRAAGQLRDPHRLTIVGPAQAEPDLNELVIAVTARMRPAVGGSLLSLNVRVAQRLVALITADPNTHRRSHLRALAHQLAVTAPLSTPRARGQRMTDDEVKSFIRPLADAGPTSATRLLRRLRDSGKSCEQARFRQLFNEVTSDVRC